MSKKVLYDTHGRRIRKLRVSLWDKCNFRCFYCMPQKSSFIPKRFLLTPQEIEYICRSLVNLGITQLRISGGEPTLREDFMDIMTRLSRLPVEKIGLTTNALLLENFLLKLKETPCRYINISLDSLVEEKFNQMTRSKGFSRVLRALLRAKEMGFHIKVNALILRGINDDELLDFVRFSAQHAIEVRFLELIKIGEAISFYDKHFLAAADMIAHLSSQEDLIPIQREFDATAFNFRTARGAHIGFIASESKPFCGSCSRLRLSAQGDLRACLMSKAGISLRHVPSEAHAHILDKVMSMKPTARIPHYEEKMYQIGG